MLLVLRSRQEKVERTVSLRQAERRNIIHVRGFKHQLDVNVHGEEINQIARPIDRAGEAIRNLAHTPFVPLETLFGFNPYSSFHQSGRPLSVVSWL